MQPRRRPVAISDARSSSLRFPVWTLIAFKVIDDPSIDTTSRTGKLIMGILALIAEFENDIRRERQQDGINKAKAQGVYGLVQSRF